MGELIFIDAVEAEARAILKSVVARCCNCDYQLSEANILKFAAAGVAAAEEMGVEKGSFTGAVKGSVIGDLLQHGFENAGHRIEFVVQPTCAVEGCGKPSVNGLCPQHAVGVNG